MNDLCLGLNWFYEGRLQGPEWNGFFWSGFKRDGLTDVYKDQRNRGQILKKNCLGVWAAGQPDSSGGNIRVLIWPVDYSTISTS